MKYSVKEKKDVILVLKNNRPVAEFPLSDSTPEEAHRLINFMLNNVFKSEKVLETICSAVKDFEERKVTFDEWKKVNEIPHNTKCDPINWRVRV